MKGIFDKKWIAESFALSTLLLIPVCVALNIVGSQLNRMLGLPFYFDMIGTIFSGMLAGPWVGALVGLMTNLVGAVVLGNPNMVPFAVVSVCVGFITGVLSHRKMFLSPIKAFVGAVVITLVTLATSAPIVLMVFGGATGANADLVTSLLVASGAKFVESVMSMQFITNGVDKFIATGVAYILIKSIPKRFLAKQPLGFIYLDDKDSANDSWE